MKGSGAIETRARLPTYLVLEQDSFQQPRVEWFNYLSTCFLEELGGRVWRRGGRKKLTVRRKISVELREDVIRF